MSRDGMGVVIVSGIPGAGKTTVARRLAQRFAMSAHIEGDAIHDLVVAGWAGPGDGDEGERQLRLRDRNIGLLVDSFASAGIVPVVDDVVVDPVRLERLREAITTSPVRLIQLAPDVRTVLARDAGRHKHVAERWLDLDGVLRSQMGGIGAWIDSTGLTVDETVDAAWSMLDVARLAD